MASFGVKRPFHQDFCLGTVQVDEDFSIQQVVSHLKKKLNSPRQQREKHLPS